MANPFGDFFREYARSCDAFDAERVAFHFHCPCVMVSRDFAVTLDRPSAILSNVEGILRHHTTNGYARASVSDIDVRHQAKNLAFVTVRWQVFRGDDSRLWNWRNSYNLADFGSGWKILVSTVHAED